jgi:hypothetical protein
MRVTMAGSARTVSFHPASLGSGGDGRAKIVQLARGPIGGDVEAAAVENLETNQVTERIRIPPG